MQKYTFLAVSGNNGWAKHDRLITAVKNAASNGLRSERKGVDVQVWFAPVETTVLWDGSIKWDGPEWPVLVGLFSVVGGGRVVDCEQEQGEMMSEFMDQVVIRKADRDEG